MAAHPSSVPAVRRFVDEALMDWGRADLVDDVGLSVTELATNVTLHSRSSYFDVELRAEDRSVRLAVVDTGAVSAASIASRVAAPAPHEGPPGLGPLEELELELDLETMTGRGLGIVASLASRWGIEELPAGTRVWAHFAEDRDYAPLAPLVTGDAQPGDFSLSTGGMVVRLLDCPPHLLLDHDDNLADLGRDLGLYAAGRADDQAAHAVEQMLEVVRASAMSWNAARFVAAQALRDGRATVDIALAVGDPADLPRKVAVLQHVTATADAMAEEGLLMSMPPSDDVRHWRAWVAQEMVEQATTRRAPLPFSQFLARR